MVHELKEQIVRSQIWRSIFRHGFSDTPRNRVLQIKSNVFLHIHPPAVPAHALKLSYTWGMGGITFLLFLVTVVTGVFLMFYYRPTGEYAYADMQYLMFDIPFGAVSRNMHRWAAHAMVICVWFHMLRVFMTGSYKSPREFNWNIGVFLLVFTLLLSFTGYLLPWDQLAVWAVTVGTNMAGAVPFLGHEGPFSAELGVTPRYDARAFLLGGTLVGPNALLRFYVFHCIFLPLIAGTLMIVHFWRIRKDGGISAPSFGGGEVHGSSGKEMKKIERVHSFPHLVRIEMLFALFVLIVLLVWSINVDAPLMEMADPAKTPNPSKAPWYFTGLQEMLVYFDPWIAGVVLPGLMVFGLMAVPYLDINPKGNGYYTFRERWFAILTFSFGFYVLWISLIIIGVFFRGPGWNFFWPWEAWDRSYMGDPGNVNLSQAFGITHEVLSSLFGAAVIFGYYFSAALFYLIKRNSGWMRKLGIVRYAVTAFLFLTMMALPIKVFLRLAFNIKYIWVTPWFNI